MLAFSQGFSRVSEPRRSAENAIFAKDDSHADDIVRIAREVLAEGNDFCQKIPRSSLTN